MSEKLYSPLVLGKMSGNSPNAVWNQPYTINTTGTSSGPLYINQPRVMYTAGPTASTYTTAASVLSNVTPAGIGG